METVELTFKYTQDEYVKAERQYLFASKIITKTSVVILSIYLPFAIWYFITSYSVLSIIALVISVFVTLLGGAVYFYAPVYRFKQTSKYHEEYNMTFSKDYIEFKTSTINSELKWDIYSELWESNDFYFLVQAPRMFTLIPKRVITNPDLKQAFEEIALSNIKCIKQIV